MKRYRIALCALAAVATAAAFWAVGWWAYQQILTLALSLVFITLVSLTF